jgi:hypothetical protein
MGGFYGLIATSFLRLYAELPRAFGGPYLIAYSLKSYLVPPCPVSSFSIGLLEKLSLAVSFAWDLGTYDFLAVVF